MTYNVFGGKWDRRIVICDVRFFAPHKYSYLLSTYLLKPCSNQSQYITPYGKTQKHAFKSQNK